MQYAAVLQKASVPLFASSPQGGEGYVNEIDPEGKMNSYIFFFYPVSLLEFYADTPGRYVLSVVLAGGPSNRAVIDVVAIHEAPIYYSPTSYYSGNNYPYYYSYIKPSFYPSNVPYIYIDYPYYYGYTFNYFPAGIWGQELAWRMEAYRFRNSP
jgi:hypothetical protein